MYLTSKCNVPEEQQLSSGMTVVRRSMSDLNRSDVNRNDENRDDINGNNANPINNLLNVENYRYVNNAYNDTNLHLKNLSFSFWEDIVLPMNMYPQGICFTEEHLMVSMYSLDADCLGQVMIFDKLTGEYLLSLGMDVNSHLGGIAYDGNHIWVCNSSKKTIERISFDFICNAIEKNTGSTLDIRNLVESYPVTVVPSCITYYDGQLWIATHTKLYNSKMASYYFSEEENKLFMKNFYTIPSKVQGVAFDEMGRVYLSTSYGRKFSSYLKIYASVENMSLSVENFMKKIEMPPCSEGLAMDDKQNIYVLFESASEKYLEGTDGFGKSISPLDKILIIESLFNDQA